MNSNSVITHLWRATCVSFLIPISLLAAPPVVKTVPWVASNPLLPHTALVGRQITLKGTCDQQGAHLTWTWDFGDGAVVATGVVTDQYVVEAQHTYAGPVGTIYTARLTIQNTTTGETGNKAYYVQVLATSLDTEVNVAIDEGLWYLHKTQNRQDPYGHWLNGTIYGAYAALGYYGVTAANLNAFEVNGHLESGNPDNPYVDTVKRAMRTLFAWLNPVAIGLQSGGNPDTNGNGIGIVVTQSYPYYQGGMFMDAIIASGTPNAVTTTGSASLLGRKYKDIVQDMADAYAWAQYDDIRYGGWRYVSNEFPDNSACQWAAIGLIAAERNWGCTVPTWVKLYNIPWLTYTQSPFGFFGYTNSATTWGPYATTPSGMVQMVLDGIGRGTGVAFYPSWERAETYMRNNFGNTGGPNNAIKDYYYGLFSFVKSLLLHNGTGGPITLLHSQTAGVPDLDWYRAEVSKGAPTDGVARTLVDDQTKTGANPGYWWAHNYEPTQYPFETAWAIMMLHQTLFESGAPVAVAKGNPNPAIVGQVIDLDGSDSYHQDANKHIVKWEWDLAANGNFTAGSPIVQTTFDAVGNYPIRLRVTDDGSTPKTAETTVTIVVSTPPLAPTADADGPYHYCAYIPKWFLDGRNSRNPDEDGHQAGAFPGDTIQEYAWDLDGDNDFNDAFGPTPDVKPFFTANAMGLGSYLIRLRVTDTTAVSYPASGMPNLESYANTILYVEEGCQCTSLAVTPILKGLELGWMAYTGASSYHVYRSTVASGPYTFIGSTTTLGYRDIAPGPLNLTYYYVIRPASLNGDEMCQSNEAWGMPLVPAAEVTCVPQVMSNLAKFYYLVDASSQAFGHMQLGIYVADTASAQVIGPIPPGSLIYLRTNLPAASVRAGAGTIERYIMTKGSARVWAQDPLGGMSVELIIP